MDRRLQGLVRLIDKRKAGDKAGAESMIDLVESSGMTGAAGKAPTCTVDGDDSADVLEPYGFACSAPAGEAIVLAPGGDIDNLVALVSSTPGRPATDAGDVAVWTVGGHEIYLDDDGGLTITGKDGATIELPDTGGVVITAASLADITLVVDNGQSVNAGGLGALPLTIWGPLSAAMTAMFSAGKLNPNGGPAFAAAEAAWNTAIGLLSPEAAKAKGV